jgi:hypothetical protein
MTCTPFAFVSFSFTTCVTRISYSVCFEWLTIKYIFNIVLHNDVMCFYGDLQLLKMKPMIDVEYRKACKQNKQQKTTRMRNDYPTFPETVLSHELGLLTHGNTLFHYTTAQKTLSKLKIHSSKHPELSLILICGRVQPFNVIN